MAVVHVMDLRTGEYVAEYSCGAKDAVVCAYAQLEMKDFNTWEYAQKYAHLVRVNFYTVSCGDYTTRLC